MFGERVQNLECDTRIPHPCQIAQPDQGRNIYSPQPELSAEGVGRRKKRRVSTHSMKNVGPLLSAQNLRGKFWRSDCVADYLQASHRLRWEKICVTAAQPQWI